MEEMIPYDDAAAVAYVRNYISQDLKEKFDEDQILYLIDLIYDYYESRGLLELANESDEEFVEIDEDELLSYVLKNAQKDGMGKYEEDDIRQVVLGEMAYCESIGMYEE
ncbi:hypothetical protein HR11_05865 [Porphyromonas macacae]|uniref:Uncharacterized protein n=1 Tax=Porphyromonas macacae TaxID=28115 RepID=A0A0A2G8W9_9PORP|nr:hypothetical protein [Porphyromonas macacae]KGN73847.1 hypothetical protein HQ47_06265 [Porphyromonas macacae]KGN99738.1 hypothetical protein HR11_05865 [Porphyromonas macacae]SUB77876.1 Uncharacterised protein [Porphyromonas macacae]SUB89660.1 Uncharacterised protein [Porphyromonas macacae]